MTGLRMRSPNSPNRIVSYIGHRAICGKSSTEVREGDTLCKRIPGLAVLKAIEYVEDKILGPQEGPNPVGQCHEILIFCKWVRTNAHISGYMSQQLSCQSILIRE